MVTSRPAHVSQWNNIPASTTIPSTTLKEIVKLRREVIVHSYIYYGKDSNVISDHEWTAKAQKLASLHAKHGIAINFYDHFFEDWDGSSGHHFRSNWEHDEGVIQAAEQLKPW